MIDNLLSIVNWQWRDAQTLWFVLVPIVWWLVNRILRQRSVNNYADSHLLAWVKVENEITIKNSVFQLKSTQGGGLGHGFGGRFVAFLGHLSAFVASLMAFVFKPVLMLSVAWICVIIAMAGPRSSVPSPDEYTRAGVDVLVAVDLSLSMTAQDVRPNRYLFMRSLIESLSNRLQANDRLALLAYEAQPHLVSPLSFDRGLFQNYLGLLRPNMLPTQGSQIKPALVFGEEHLQQTAGNARVLIVFSDGEPKNFVEQEEPTGFADLMSSNTKIILVGVGENARVKIPDASHASGYLHHSGLLVTTRLEEPFLQSLAGRIKGVYLKSDTSQLFMNKLLNEVALDAEKRHFESTHTVWEDHAMPFIWIAFFSLLMAFYPIKWRTNNVTKTAPILLLAVWLHFLPIDSLAGKAQIQLEQEAFSAYKNKNYDLSQQLYDGVEGYQGWFGAGAAAYKAEDYESSVAYFRQSVLVGVTIQQRSDALFNLGNSYYRANLLLQAISAYQQALKYLPANEKTKHNLALAQQRRQIEEGMQRKDEQGDGTGKGSQSRDDEGAFYGGQKPNSDPGEGVAGDSPEGEKQGKDFVLPQLTNETDFSLQSSTRLTLNDTSMGNSILAKLHQEQRMEKFSQAMKGVQDNQAKLLMGIFEREEGFQSVQNEPHEVPGVKPW